MRILGIQSCAVEGFGRFEQLLQEKGARLELVAFGRTEQELMEELAPHVDRMARLSDLLTTNLVNEIG